MEYEDAPLAGNDDSDYKKQEKEKAANIKKLYDEYPDNEIIKKMYDDVEQEQREMNRKGPSPFQYIHEAVWAACQAYESGDISFQRATDDLIEAIQATQKFISDSKQVNKPSK